MPTTQLQILSRVCGLTLAGALCLPMASATAATPGLLSWGMDHTVLAAASASPKKPKRKMKKSATQPVDRAADGESMDRREQRLKRECKGRPNAGACLGFAN